MDKPSVAFSNNGKFHATTRRIFPAGTGSGLVAAHPCVCGPCFALIKTLLEHIIMDNLIAWQFEPICYNPQPLIRTGFKGSLPRSCNGPATQPSLHP